MLESHQSCKQLTVKARTSAQLARMAVCGHAGVRHKPTGQRGQMDDLILTVRARRLMKEMRQLRTARKLTVARAAVHLGISEPTLWRMENGKSKINAEILVAALDLYDVPSPRREALERLG